MDTMMWRSIATTIFMVMAPMVGRAASDDSWSYLVDKLVADGFDSHLVVAAFDDPRMPAFDGLDFSPNRPRESYARYRHFLRGPSVTQARRCRLQFADAVEDAERRTQVSADVLTAILHVETGCGRNTGSYGVLYRLARLAMANEPANLQRNFWRFADRDGTLDADTEARLRERARYLEDTFYPEVRATFQIAQRLSIDPLAMRGSPSGAFGYPQFLPTSFLRHGVDGDGDGAISLYDPADAAASAARYLAAHGWRPGLSRTQQRQVIWHYNHSDAYVDTVLNLATRIGAPATAVQVAAKPKPKAKRIALKGKSKKQTALKSKSSKQTAVKTTRKTAKQKKAANRRSASTRRGG